MLLTYQATLKISQDELQEGQRLFHFYEKGEQIPLEVQGVWEVYRGIVQLSTVNPNGDDVLLGWAKPSVLFGIWLTRIEMNQAKALSDVYLRQYSVTEIENSPHLSQKMLTQVVQRLRQTETLLTIAGIRRVDERLKQLLMLLKEELGEPVAEGTRLSVRFTHQNLANAINATRVTVTKLLNQFQQNNYIQLDSDRRIILLE
jgi:CRP-like cAMP-binding protein